jgi:hypothetical protein
VFYGSNLYRKDNPCWGFSNATETRKVPGAAFRLILPPGHSWDQPLTGGTIVASFTGWARNACGLGAAWLIGLPRRAGAQLHAMNDAEAHWWHWQVTEYRGGLVRRYRDARFEALTDDPALRRVAELVIPGQGTPGRQCREGC